MGRIKQIFLVISMVFLLISAGGIFSIQGYAQKNRAQNEEEKAKAEEKRKKLIKEMEKLIKVAKDAGFSEEELQKITIEQEGELINVWSFLQEEEQSRKDGSVIEKVEHKKHYLTIQDITSELIKGESAELSRLRKDLIFSGEEQK